MSGYKISETYRFAQSDQSSKVIQIYTERYIKTRTSTQRPCNRPPPHAIGDNKSSVKFNLQNKLLEHSARTTSVIPDDPSAEEHPLETKIKCTSRQTT